MPPPGDTIFVGRAILSGAWDSPAAVVVRRAAEHLVASDDTHDLLGGRASFEVEGVAARVAWRLVLEGQHDQAPEG